MSPSFKFMLESEDSTVDKSDSELDEEEDDEGEGEEEAEDKGEALLSSWSIPSIVVLSFFPFFLLFFFLDEK